MTILENVGVEYLEDERQSSEHVIVIVCRCQYLGIRRLVGRIGGLRGADEGLS